MPTLLTGLLHVAGPPEPTELGRTTCRCLRCDSDLGPGWRTGEGVVERLDEHGGTLGHKPLGQRPLALGEQRCHALP